MLQGAGAALRLATTHTRDAAACALILCGNRRAAGGLRGMTLCWEQSS
ncbi:hypothetical protein SALB1_2316 [Salinisphaera sp. LB1]|nr:hypothetical protein SALB1_2316 [Salinisphaera sp. LB1]